MRLKKLTLAFQFLCTAHLTRDSNKMPCSNGIGNVRLSCRKFTEMYVVDWKGYWIVCAEIWPDHLTPTFVLQKNHFFRFCCSPRLRVEIYISQFSRHLSKWWHGWQAVELSAGTWMQNDMSGPFPWNSLTRKKNINYAMCRRPRQFEKQNMKLASSWNVKMLKKRFSFLL